MLNVLFLREHNRIARLARGRLPRLGRRAAVPDRAQHPDRAPDQDRDRGVHQPHHAVPLQAARRPDRRSATRALVPARTGWRSSSTCSTAGTAWSRRRCRIGGARARRAGHALQHRRSSSSTGWRALLRGRLAASAAGRVGLFNTDPVLRDGRARERARRRAPSSSRPTTTTASSRVPARDRASTRSRATAASRTALRDALRAASTRSSSTRACSPRTSRPNAVLPALIGRMVGDRRVLAGADQPAAVAARVQPADVLAARLEIDPDDRHAVGRAAPQHPRTPGGATRSR